MFPEYEDTQQSKNFAEVFVTHCQNIDEDPLEVLETLGVNKNDFYNWILGSMPLAEDADKIVEYIEGKEKAIEEAKKGMVYDTDGLTEAYDSLTGQEKRAVSAVVNYYKGTVSAFQVFDNLTDDMMDGLKEAFSYPF